MIDEKDTSILGELRKNARETTKGIAKKTNIARITVHERIKRLVQRGIVKKFTIITDYKKLGAGTTAFVLVAYVPGKILQKEVAARIARLPNVSEVHLIAGEWDMIAKIRGKDLENIGKLVLEKIRGMEGVAKTFTLACFENIKEDV